MKTRGPVFFDKIGRRAFLTNVILTLVGLAVSVGVLTVVVGIVITPLLPNVGDPLSDRRQRDPGAGSLVSESPSGVAIGLANNRLIAAGAAKSLRFAFFSSDDSGAFLSLRQHASQIDALIPDWLRLKGTYERPSVGNDLRRIPVLGWLRDAMPSLKLYPRLTTDLTPTQLAILIARPTDRAALADEINDHLRRDNVDGVVIAFPDLPASTFGNLLSFLSELGSRLKSKQRKLIVQVASQITLERLNPLARVSDNVLFELLERKPERLDPHPITEQSWFEAQLRSPAFRLVHEKAIVTVGSFGYAWDSRGAKRMISVQSAWDVLARSDASLTFGARSLSPAISYVDAAGTRAHIELLDAVTAFNEIKVALAGQPAGIAVWRLGLEDPGVWRFACRGCLPNEDVISALERMAPGYGSLSEARGVMIAAQPGFEGSRSISYNPVVGLAVDERIDRPPRQFVVRTWEPTDARSIVLTFDDGPSFSTAAILDILAEKSVKASFFIIGSNALVHQSLLHRMYVEGHDIGNHTFWHPNLFGDSSRARIRWELNSTQRIIEHSTGMRSLLFRPPYIAEDYGLFDGAPEFVTAGSELGYVFVGFDADPFDYATGGSHIADDVIRSVEAGSRVILLHDAPRDREATIKALPVIIDQLRARGFRFQALHEMIGVSRNELMAPRHSHGLLRSAEFESRGTALNVVLLVWKLLPVMALGCAILGIVRLLLVIFGALFQAKRLRSATRTGWLPRKIAVLVPAHNEEKTICKTVDALLGSSYRGSMDVLVIDDGSADATAEVVKSRFGHVSSVWVYRKENGGKGSALNFGIEHTDAEIIVAIDGDTVVLPNAIELLVAHFSDASIGAVAGVVEVGNPNNLLTAFQAIEYITSQNLDRRAFELFNAITVVPGAIGAWRRSAMVEIGGYSSDTLAEDADLTLSVQRRGWRVVAEPGARALTEVPETLTGFMRQRFRWMFGMLQVAYKHARLTTCCDGICLLTIPNIVIFQFGFTLLAPVMDVALASSLLLLSIGSESTQTLVIVSRYWLLFQTLDALAAAIGIALNKSGWALLPVVILQRFTYRQLLYVSALRALLAALKGRFVGWGKLIRTGHVCVPAALRASV